MILYKEFANLYAKGPYSFSERLVKYLPKVFNRFRIQPKKVLDLCCGDGRFVIAMVRKGIDVTGVDASPHMLKYASQRARKARVKVQLAVQKMQHLNTQTRFDLVTCWFDSINYLLTKSDLDKTFRNINRVLNNGGIFIFDINTIYGLSVNWQDNSPCVLQDTDRLFEVHICPPNFKRNIATLKIVGFIRQGRYWRRIEEVHQERGYRLKEIRKSFRKAHFIELGCWESLKTMKKPKRDSGKVFFILRKIH
ncbi:MAG: class I SAM-dependent methyltransferase [bacterium]